MDYGPPDSSVHEILQTRIREWVVGKPLLSPRDLPNPGVKPRSPALQADSLPSEPPGKPLALKRRLTLLATNGRKEREYGLMEVK